MPYHQVQAANDQHHRKNGRKSFGAYRFRATERLGPLLGNPAIGNGKYQQAQAENTITKARHFSNPISRERVSISFTWPWTKASNSPAGGWKGIRPLLFITFFH